MVKYRNYFNNLEIIYSKSKKKISHNDSTKKKKKKNKGMEKIWNWDKNRNIYSNYQLLPKKAMYHQIYIIEKEGCYLFQYFWIFQAFCHLFLTLYALFSGIDDYCCISILAPPLALHSKTLELSNSWFIEWKLSFI